MSRLKSNGRARLLDEQEQEEETIFSETNFDHQHQTRTRPAPREAHARAHRGSSVYTRTPLLSNFTSSPWGHRKWSGLLLKALLCVAVVGGLVWATRQLYTSYRSSWSVTVTEQHYRDSYLLWHQQNTESRSRQSQVRLLPRAWCFAGKFVYLSRPVMYYKKEKICCLFYL